MKWWTAPRGDPPRPSLQWRWSNFWAHVWVKQLLARMRVETGLYRCQAEMRGLHDHVSAMRVELAETRDRVKTLEAVTRGGRNCPYHGTEE